MKLSEQRLEELAQACRLALTPEEIGLYTKDLASLEMLAKALLTVDLDAAETEGRAARRLAEWRDDAVVTAGCCREALLAASQSVQDGYISVPRAVEEAQ